jgi:hypothetical protein
MLKRRFITFKPQTNAIFTTSTVGNCNFSKDGFRCMTPATALPVIYDKDARN